MTKYRCMNYHYDFLEIDYDSDTGEIQQITPRDETKTKSAYNKLPNGHLEIDTNYISNVKMKHSFSGIFTDIHYYLDTDRLVNFSMYDKLDKINRLIKRDNRLSVKVLNRYVLEVSYKNSKGIVNNRFSLKFTPKPKKIKKEK